eukprot:jgi/Psemu1/52011/gm1.52011_g
MLACPWATNDVADQNAQELKDVGKAKLFKRGAHDDEVGDGFDEGTVELGTCGDCKYK